MTTPTNFRELLDYLERNPRVRILDPIQEPPRPLMADGIFLVWKGGIFWFQDTQRGYTRPIFVGHRIDPMPRQRESDCAIAYDTTGFTVESGGLKIPYRVEYLESQPSEAVTAGTGEPS